MEAENPWYYYVLIDVLIKEEKPCLSGDYVHLHGEDGCFYVHEVNVKYFVIRKNHELKKIPWERFRCKQGEGWKCPEKKPRNLQPWQLGEKLYD